MKIRLFCANVPLAASIGVLATSCTCHDEAPRADPEKQKNGAGNTLLSPDVPEPPGKVSALKH